MRAPLLHLTVCAAAAAAPLVAHAPPPSATKPAVAFPGWPAEFDGRALRELPASAMDRRFARDLPGSVRRFTDGEREIVVRWSAEPTRHVHPASVCFAAHGWRVEPLPHETDAAGRRWSAFAAVRGDERLRVAERVEDGSGRSWAEPTAWYWASLLGETSGPAWVWTVARRP